MRRRIGCLPIIAPFFKNLIFSRRNTGEQKPATRTGKRKFDDLNSNLSSLVYGPSYAAKRDGPSLNALFFVIPHAISIFIVPFKARNGSLRLLVIAITIPVAITITTINERTSKGNIRIYYTSG